jgi:hypothetical protein
MAYIKLRAEKAPGLDQTEIVALRGVSNRQVVEGPATKRLEKLGLVVRNSGNLDLTEQGRITLMFAAARWQAVWEHAVALLRLRSINALQSIPTRNDLIFHTKENIVAKKTFMETIETLIMGDATPVEVKAEKSKTVKQRVAKKIKAKSIKKTKAKNVKAQKTNKKRWHSVVRASIRSDAEVPTWS